MSKKKSVQGLHSVQETLSLDDIRSAVRDQVRQMCGPEGGDGPYVYIVEMYMGYAIVEIDGGEYYRVPYNYDGANTVTVAGRTDWKQVTKEWVVAESARRREGRTESSVRTFDLHEAVDLTEATLDEATHTVRNARLIRAGWSLNERYYPDTVLAASVGLWESAKAYADHPGKNELKDRPERSVRDIVGYYSQPVHEGGVTRADFKVLGEAQGWLWPLIAETISTGVPLVGLSINALGQTRMGEAEGKRGPVVEAITHAHSVDVVTTPAAGGGFAPLQASDDGGWTRAVLSTMTLEELRAARPDLISALKREWKSTRDTQALESARRDSDGLREQLEAVQQAVETAQQENRTLREQLKAALVDRLLADKKLPEAWRMELRQTLVEADEAQWESILEREHRKAAALRGKVPVTGAGRPAPVTVTSPPAAGRAQPESWPHDNESYTEWLHRTGRRG